ncbi:energy transducer TonB [Crenobacter intestini]|uniref:Protein TonB n=1 Tax=Crenobacter intestini TaxID=2563443 RepID=A0A4T0V0N7_9NEIS|nr:energy transducer TonB [Crenobacter intestini]TIC84751.1 energy transducer TonB [Crenobacter intestini]
MKRLARRWPLAASLTLHALAAAALAGAFAVGAPTPRALSVSLLPVSAAQSPPTAQTPASPAARPAPSAKALPARPQPATPAAQPATPKPRAVTPAPAPKAQAAITPPTPAAERPPAPAAGSAAAAPADAGKPPAAAGSSGAASAAEGTGLARQGVDWRAALAANPKPVYPERSRALGEQGRVVLRVRVGADGRALEVSVLQGSGHPRLDRAAREAVGRWRFVPARQGGVAVEDSVDVPIRFEQAD